MDICTLTRAELIRALSAVSDNGMGLSDGTYRLIPGWIGSRRTWSAERVTERDGYEVALSSAIGDWDHSALAWGGPDARYGVWTDDNGSVCIDRTVHVMGTLDSVMSIAQRFDQDAVWAWDTSSVIATSSTVSISLDSI